MIEDAREEVEDDTREQTPDAEVSGKSRFISRWGIFFSGYTGQEEKDTTETAGYDQDNKGLIAGVDYSFTNGLVAGGIIQGIVEDRELTGCLGERDLDELGAGLILTYRLSSSISIDFVTSYADRDFQIRNTIAPIEFAFTGEPLNPRDDNLLN